MPKQPFIPAAGVTQVEMKYTMDSQVCENVYHFLAGELTAQKAHDIADFLVNTWETQLARPYRGNHCWWTGITLRDMSTQDGVVYTPQPSTSFQGSAAGAGYPNSVTLAVKHVTGLGGRSFRGRSFWIGLTESQAAGNTVTGPVVAGITTAYNRLIDDNAKGIVGDMVVVSKRHDNAWRIGGAVVTPIVSFSTDPTIDNQRRRLPGRGK